MSHDHAHHDSRHGHEHHDHGSSPRDFGRAFALGIALNLGFVTVEAFYGWQAGSLALLADAGHNLSDVAGLVIAWAAIAAARLKATERNTYGWRRGSILAAFINAAVLLLAMGSLAWEAAWRLQNPAPIAGMTMIVVAAIGVAINGLTAVLFLGGQHDLNIRGAFLHMAGDAFVSLGVVITGALYLWQGWTWIDPVASLAIALIIIVSTWSLFRQSLHLLFDGVPAHIDLGAVRAALLDLPQVTALHDLHVWALASMETALTAHLVVPAGTAPHDALLHEVTQLLRERFGIAHVTLQVETEAYGEGCTQDACSKV